MNKQASIKYISGLLSDSSQVADNDASSIAGLRQSYPYFVPARYLDAFVRNRSNPFSAAMLSSVTPYLGNWMLFCDFATGRASTVPGENESPAEEMAPDVSANVADTGDSESGIPASEVAGREMVNPVEGGSVVDEVMSMEETGLAPIGDDLDAQHDNFWFQEHDATVEEQRTEGVKRGETNLEIVMDEPADASRETDAIQAVQDAFAEAPESGREKDKPLINPVYIDDYFLQQGEKVPAEMPGEISSLMPASEGKEDAKSLMVMMSFSEWLLHFKNTGEKQKEETRDQRALKTMWQKEKLAAAIEEENEEIPENVFEMAVNSITKEDGLASEPLAEIYIKQGKPDKAIDIYRKLSLRNPQKSAYFALKIEGILKDKKS